MTEQNGSARFSGPGNPGHPAARPSESPDRDGTDQQVQAPDPAGTGQSETGEQSPDASAAPSAGGRSGPAKLNELVDEPAKVMRIGTMIKQLLEEVRNAPLDDAARNRLAEIHERSLTELYDGLAPELVTELERINLPFPEDTTPTDAELRIAQAQLVGWLEGLFRGIQTAIAAQQTANQQLQSRLQLRQLPPGTVLAPGVVIGENGEPKRTGTAAQPGQQPGAGAHVEPHAGPGQYL
ncbi:bacterial proteasome activator family protein [Arthrobacter gandavensis]|uniref:bacterial proteasome activator family protein n=1 Tax=Arthrobacter gandavensis TaxID=169960 RepID=UPI00188DDAAD|nr:bacterial proteasome activator family protein [Arthrobacter gandavensis]MBF4992559.1 bacterial proteasome activator family protein [Arthrobacter gandavensis]